MEEKSGKSGMLSTGGERRVCVNKFFFLLRKRGAEKAIKE
jgi:hypothetical protein